MQYDFFFLSAVITILWNIISLCSVWIVLLLVTNIFNCALGMPFQCKSYSKRSYHHHLKNSLKRLKAYGDSKRQQSTVIILIAEQFTYGDTRPSINDQNFRFVHFMILILLFKYGGLQKKKKKKLWFLFYAKQN